MQVRTAATRNLRGGVLLVALAASLSVATSLTIDGSSEAIAKLGTAPPGRFAAARVCPYEAFSRRLDRCTRDERAAPLATNRFTCSVTVHVARPATLRYRASYDGLPLSGWRPIGLQPGVFPAWFAYDLGTNVPLPGGAWSCTFVLGAAKATVPFRTRGPTGDVVDLVVCAGQDTIGAYQNGICRKDESTTGVPPTGVILCSLFVTRRVGSVPRIDILDGSGDVIFSHTGSTITSVLWPAWAWANAASQNRIFVPGAYACRVSLDGNVVQTTSFTVRG